MQYTTYLRWGVLAGIFLVPFVPFIIADGNFFPSAFFPYITGKNFAFRILVALMVLGYMLLALKEPKYRPQPSVLLWAALAFVGWMGVATLFAVDPVKSFWSNFERMEGYVGLLHLFAWFLVTGAVLSAERLWERFFNVTVFASAVQGVYALMQYFGAVAISTQSGVRLDTTFGNAAYMSVYMLIHIFLTLYLMARTGTRSAMMWLYGPALALQVFALYFSETRGAILGLVGGLIVAAVWLALRERANYKLRQGAFVGLGLIAVVVAGFFAVRNTPVVEYNNTLRRLANISLADSTTQSRFLIWNMAKEGALERPVTGWGQENFSFIFNKHYSPAMYAQEQWFDRAHNQFLDWLVAGGVPAFLLHISLYALGAWVVVRSRLSVAEQAALLGLLAGYAVNNSFVFDNLVSAVLFWALLAYLHSLAMRPSPSLTLSRPLGDQALAVTAPVVAGVVLFGAWALNVPGMARAVVLVDALQTQVPVTNDSGVVVGAARNPEENIAGFARAAGVTLWPGTELGFQEVSEQLFQFASNAIAPSASVNPDLKQQAYVLARGTGERLLAQRPGDARLELFMATFLGQFGQTGEAVAHLERALELSPKKQQILIQLGATYLQAGNAEQGLAALQQAFELEPRYDLARFYYAGALYTAGATAQADALLTERFGTTVVDDDQLLRLYTNLKLHQRAIAIWQARVQKDPQNPEVRLGLASAQFAACDISATLATLRGILAIAPTSAPQIQDLINQVEKGTLQCPR